MPDKRKVSSSNLLKLKNKLFIRDFKKTSDNKKDKKFYY